MENQAIEGYYRHIIQNVLLPNKNVHFINLENYEQTGAYVVIGRGYQLQVHIESAYDLVNFMKPVFAATQLIGAYRHLNDEVRDFIEEIQSIEQSMIKDGWLSKEYYSDIEGILKENAGGRIEELQTIQVATPAIVDSSSFEKVLNVSSKKASSIVLYDTFEGKKIPVGIGFVVNDEAGEELFVIFSFHTTMGLFGYISAMVNVNVTVLSNLNTQHAEIAVAQEILRVNDFLKKAGVFV